LIKSKKLVGLRNLKHGFFNSSGGQSKKIYNLNNVLCYHRIYKNSTFNPTNSENLGVLKNKWLNIKYLNN